jgi:hypothetical protein
VILGSFLIYLRFLFTISSAHFPLHFFSSSTSHSLHFFYLHRFHRLLFGFHQAITPRSFIPLPIPSKMATWTRFKPLLLLLVTTLVTMATAAVGMHSHYHPHPHSMFTD